VHVCQRAEGHGERFVDDALIAQMQLAILNFPHGGRTMVMLTGDGNDNEGRASFLQTIGLALNFDWRVEVTNEAYLHMLLIKLCTEGRGKRMIQQNTCPCT
jgi:hypothetical protein